jgi:hypothetical protein
MSNNTIINDDTTSNHAKIVYALSQYNFNNHAARNGVMIHPIPTNAIKFPVLFPNSFSFPIALKFSSVKAWMVPLQKLLNNHPKIAAMINPVNEGRNNITNDDNRLQIPAITNDFFLHVVSAKTDVGNSNHRTVINPIFDTKIISASERPVYLYNKVITGVRNVIHINT